MTPNREETLFAAALELPAGERVAYLARECGADGALRARVAALLASYDATANPLVTQFQSSEAPVPGLNFAEDDRVGQMLGRYKLLEKLGEGGCGVVYVAEQTEPVRRRVALKVIKLGMDTKQVVARFEAERQALALMDHPNIAKVLDAGTTEAGRPFFVMELVRGIRITDYCDQTNLSTQERLNLFIKVCQAIQHAHQKGIIHRDIKPSNILVTLHDGVPVPKVIDFGIAKATEGRLTEATVYTQLNQFIGTPAYMSPEQAEMSGLDIDTRSDIYSLGVLLYELLIGRPPFDPKELMSLGLDAMRKTIRERDPARPSTKLATLATLEAEELTTTAKRRATETSKLVSQLKGDLDWIVMKCLEKDRTRRYETANGLASDITRHLTNEPVVARPPSARYKLQKAFRRNKLVYVAGTVVFVALMLGVMLSVWQAVRAQRAEQFARQRLEESEAISKFMTEVFQSPDPAKDGRTITVVETLGAAAKKLEKDLESQPERRAQLQAVLGQTYASLGLFAEATQMERRVHQFYLSTSGPTHTNTLNSALRLGAGLGAANPKQIPEGLELLQRAVAEYRRQYGSDHPATLKAMLKLSGGLREFGDRKEALDVGRDLLERQQRILGSEHPETIQNMSNVAAMLMLFGNTTEAVKLSAEALRLRRKLDGRPTPALCEAMWSHSFCLTQADQIAEASKLSEELLPMLREIMGPENSAVLSLMVNMTADYMTLNRLSDAQRMAQEAYDLGMRVQGPKSGIVINSLGNLSQVHARLGHGDEAVRLGEQVLATCRALNGPDGEMTLQALTELGRTCLMVNRIPEAIAYAETALKAGRPQLPAMANETTITMRLLIEIYEKTGDASRRAALTKELDRLTATLNSTSTTNQVPSKGTAAKQ